MNRFCTILTQTAPQESGMNSMVNMLDIFLWVMLLGYGAYALYAAIRLRRTYMLFPNKILYPGNCAPETCLDEDGFIDYILPRVTVWGIVMVVFGAVFMLNNYVLRITGLWVDITSIVLPVVALVWYMLIQRKAAKLFW